MKKSIKHFILVICALSIFVPSFVVHAADTSTSSWRQIFPECIQQQMQSQDGSKFTVECDDVGVFVQLAINIGAYLFTFIGALALLVFVYGGFKMIISAGDSGKIKEGKDAMIAAVIGIVIAFSGVAIVRFLGNSLTLKGEFRIENVEPTKKFIICCRTIEDKPLNTAVYKQVTSNEECIGRMEAKKPNAQFKILEGTVDNPPVCNENTYNNK